MSSKLLVVVSTGEKEKAYTGMMFAHLSRDQKFMDDVKIVFMGPVEKLLAEDKDLQDLARQMVAVEPPVACRFISDQGGFSDKIEALGLKLEFVGSIIAGFLKDGYAPMVF
ncbi:MAG: hypothetical protein V1816_01875 [Pseudomonadota bacterium]